MDKGAWQATVHGVTKSQTWLSTHAYFNKIKCIDRSFRKKKTEARESQTHREENPLKTQTQREDGPMTM